MTKPQKARAAGQVEISAEDRAKQFADLDTDAAAPPVEPVDDDNDDGDEPAVETKIEPAVEPAPINSADPFGNLDALRLGQSFVEMAGAKKLLTTVPVRKPNKQEYIRVIADPTYRMDCAIIELKEDREVYFVIPAIAAAMPNEVIPVTLFTAVNRQGVVFLWPVRMPTSDRRTSAWYNSARTAAEIAMTKWVRVVANMSLGAYEIFEASGVIPDPEPIEHSFKDLLRIGFRADRFVGRLDHDVLKLLRGE
jgi:hypothetical protein